MDNDSDASLDDTFEDLCSDSDDDDTEASRKAEQRADMLIATIASKEGCSYQAAMQMIVDNPKLMAKAGVTKSKMKHFSMDTHLGREKFKRKLFEKTIIGIGYQQELREILKLYFGSQLTLSSIIKNWSTCDWPFEILILYVFEIGESEMDKLKDLAKKRNTKFDESHLKFLVKERELMKAIMVDSLFLSKKKDQRSYILNALEYVLNKERNHRNKVFSVAYMKDRGSLMSDSDSIKENYIFNYNNKVKKLKGRTRPLVSFNNTNSNNKNNKSNDNNNDEEEKPYCPFFNGTKGCIYGVRCWKKNLCIECNNKRHGAATCFRIGRNMIDKGIIQKILERRPGVRPHDPRNGVIIGVDGRNYFLNQHNNNNNNNSFDNNNHGNWGNNNNRNGNGGNNNRNN